MTDQDPETFEVSAEKEKGKHKKFSLKYANDYKICNPVAILLF